MRPAEWNSVRGTAQGWPVIEAGWSTGFSLLQGWARKSKFQQPEGWTPTAARLRRFKN
jgi:hypothetical protein